MKIKSRLFDEASGSIGNVTAANGLGGLYFKNKPNPSNPKTAAQTVVRNALSAANTAWNAASEAVRASWQAYGATCSHTNQTGAIVTLNGWNAFSRAFVVFSQAGQATAPLSAAAPAGAGYLSEAVVSLESDGDGGLVSVTNDSGAAATLVIYVGKGTRNTINNYGGSFNFNVLAEVADNGSTATTTAQVGDKAWIRLQSIKADGQMSRGAILSTPILP